MERVILNKNSFGKVGEVVTKRKLILHDDSHVIAYKTGNHVYQFPTFKGDDKIYSLTKIGTLIDADLTVEKLEEVVELHTYMKRLTSMNYKLIPTVREKISEFYGYQCEINDDVVDSLNILPDNQRAYFEIVSISDILDTKNFQLYKNLVTPVEELTRML